MIAGGGAERSGAYRNFGERLLHLGVKLLAKAMFRLRRHGPLPVPTSGGAIIAPNHVTFVDALIVAALCDRPVRFVIDADRARQPVVQWFVRLAGAIPIAPRKEEPATLDAAFRLIGDALRAGDLVCIFPEGSLTDDGEIHDFRPGIERIVRETPVPVVPLALRGLWGSLFSQAHGGPFKGPLLGPAGIWRREVEAVAGAALPPGDVTAERLEAIVRSLRGSMA